ncbi:hypothetical protein J2S17_004756 [Cytobacillus purgationiresistens]|uniref:Uncharacterized protein n=1 Tax=Cytobacillus purgationiresistens TaxID=863449 RepID=A0ABU0ANJ4_9BACI|nr:hypothetical protein [Cytobacillus purgationiresistens]
MGKVSYEKLTFFIGDGDIRSIVYDSLLIFEQ